MFERVEFVQADLLDPASLTTAIAGSTHVIHTASPFVIDEPNDPNVLIRPAVGGTVAVLEAAKAAAVQRVSITSSMASICSMDAVDKPDVFDESHWSDTNWQGMSAYEKSKTLAERAAWDFVAAQPENERIELTVINPTFIIGPTLIPGDFSSGKIISMFMNDNMPGGCPRIKMGTVDVRDVAKAHVNAIKSNEAQGKRFILANTNYWF